jgi:para-nitrobenzyl esterase
MSMAKGLFHRVIAQSTPHYYATDGKKAADDLFQMLGIKSGDINALRKISTEKLLDAQVKIYMKSSTVTSTNPWAPTVDGKTLLQDPLEFFQQGKTDIELLIGSNLDENKLFSFMDPRAPEIDLIRVKKRVQRFMNLFGQEEDRSNQLIDVYLEERRDKSFSLEPRDLYDNIATDLWFRILSIRLAEAQSKKKSSFMYLFTWESPFKHPKQGVLGSAHAVDIPFVFNSLNLPGMDIFAGRGKDAENLSGDMMQSWISFARTGNPNHGGIPEWDHYDSDNRTTMVFGKKIETVKDPFRKTRIIWNGIF